MSRNYNSITCNRVVLDRNAIQAKESYSSLVEPLNYNSITLNRVVLDRNVVHVKESTISCSSRYRSILVSSSSSASSFSCDRAASFA